MVFLDWNTSNTGRMITFESKLQKKLQNFKSNNNFSHRCLIRHPSQNVQFCLVEFRTLQVQRTGLESETENYFMVTLYLFEL